MRCGVRRRSNSTRAATSGLLAMGTETKLPDPRSQGTVRRLGHLIRRGCMRDSSGFGASEVGRRERDNRMLREDARRATVSPKLVDQVLRLGALWMLALACALAGGLVVTPLAAADARGGAVVRDGVVLVGFEPGVRAGRQRAVVARVGATGLRRLSAGARIARGHRSGTRRLGATVRLRVRRGTVLSAVRSLRKQPGVAYAEPDYLLHEAAAPNDPSFGLQWAHSNTGQLVNGVSGTVGADDRGLAAWGVASGSSSIVIGETDSGVDYRHPDLAANIWSNPGGIGGCSTGSHGYNVLLRNCDPMDDEKTYGGHGTHVAGILGAVGNNGVGVAGVNWTTTILPVKWLDSSGYGYTDQLISALDWLVKAKQAGINIRVVNDSATFVGTAYSQALADEIDVLGANDILFVTAAGNTGDNNDDPAKRRYPCGYQRPTELCVTASDQYDRLPSWANYGSNTVDLAAPGVNIYSTLRNGTYGYISGGSMASPQVAGAAALILAQGYQSVSALRADILGNVDVLPSLSNLVRTNGRLNICKALSGCANSAPPPGTYTLGNANVGTSSDVFAANRKRVNRYVLSAAGNITKLSVYLATTSKSGQEALRGVLYANSGGSPGRLLAASNELVFHSTDRAGWYDLTLPAPVALTAGTYWLGVLSGATGNVASYRWDSVPGSRVYNNNTYTSGPSDPFGSVIGSDAEEMSLYATYTVGSPPTSAPTNTSPPTITGTPQSGQTLIAGNGSWSASPTSYGYQWLRCDTSGSSCTAISGATLQTYALGSGDVGSTMRVAVTATNSSGASQATSAPTAVVQQASQTTGTLGKNTVGTSADSFAADRKRVNRYSLAATGTVSKLSIYLAPTSTAGQQTIKGVIYADASGAPGSLMASSNELVFHSTDKAGWYDLVLSAPRTLTAGNYWIGVLTGASAGVASFRWDSVSGGRVYNNNTYTSGPTDPFGSIQGTDNEQASLYATYTLA
jgi:thermitase